MPGCQRIRFDCEGLKSSARTGGGGHIFGRGQALDPIDDMTERLSDVLVTAITSLGVQKLAYEIGVSIAPQLFAIFLLALSIVSWFENDR